MKTIEIIVPCYNESENIRPLYEAIQSVFAEKLPDYSYTLLFVNDGSSDNSLEVLKSLVESDMRVKYLSFSRNFGHQLAVKAGLDHSWIAICNTLLPFCPSSLPNGKKAIK